jgi:hypothetical protein
MSELDSKDFNMLNKMNESTSKFRANHNLEVPNSQSNSLSKPSVGKVQQMDPKILEQKLEKQKSFNINLKYLFIAVVYLKLRSDLFTNIGDRVLEIGINDIIDVYGKGEICQGKLGRYIDCVKSIARDNKLNLNLEISYDQRK